MKKIIVLVLVAMMLSSVCYAKTKSHVKPKHVASVNIGDSYETVTDKLGDPHQVLSKNINAEGKEQTVWMYEAIKVPSHDGFITTHPDLRVQEAKAYRLLRETNPPYLVIFIDGKVAGIQRQ